jgi:hypothetical protein
MKRYFMAIIVMLVLASILSGCRAVETTKPVPTKTDMPTLTQEEVRALVYNYLEARASLVSPMGTRQPLLNALAIARPNSTATYQGNGKWQVSGLGYGLEDEKWLFNYSGLWNLYEVSRAIEPANKEASQLLLYIQRWTN